MKALALTLVALVSTVQTVGWVECCCALICKHRNDPCKDECKPAPAVPAHDCCDKPSPQAPSHEHDKRCAHVEPSSEVESQAAELPAMTLDLVLVVPPAILLPGETAKTERLFSPSRGSPPPLLHLLYGALLI
jgi:hypothetical protein